MNNSKKINYSIENKPSYFKMIERISMNWSIQSMLKYNDAGCLNFDAPYQRDLVWTLKQKQEYIMALFSHKAEIKPTLILDDTKNILSESLDHSHFIVLDGKQRLNAIIEFHNNEFPLLVGDDKIYYENLTQDDKLFFISLDINYTRVAYRKKLETVPIEIQLELFLEINALGTKQTDEHLKNIVNMVSKEFH